MDKALDEIYKEIPNIPACSGACADACGPIAMTEGEWKRIIRKVGHVPKPTRHMVCPMLSPTGSCMVYTVRPYICRIWGSVEELRCPAGCEPDRWLTRDEARDIFNRIVAIAGPGTNGPLGKIDDLWHGIALDQRAARAEAIKKARKLHGLDA